MKYGIIGVLSALACVSCAPPDQCAVHHPTPEDPIVGVWVSDDGAFDWQYFADGTSRHSNVEEPYHWFHLPGYTVFEFTRFAAPIYYGARTSEKPESARLVENGRVYASIVECRTREYSPNILVVGDMLISDQGDYQNRYFRKDSAP